MVSQAHRYLPGRAALAALTVGAVLSLSACGLPFLPPAFQGAEPEPAPTPIESEEPVEEETDFTAPETEEPEPLGAQDEDVFVLGIGDCINEWSADDDENVSSVPKIDCSEPHDREVYYEGTLDESGPYPAGDALNDMVNEGCVDAFEDFVGTDYVESALDFSSLMPTEDGWEQGDREYLCLIGQYGEQTTGTLEDAQM